MKIKPGDIILVIFILAVAAMGLLMRSGSGDTVVIEVDGGVVKTLSLDKDTSYIYEGKYTNSITVSDGKVCVESSDCPDGTCVRSGNTDSSDKVICCLPNKLIIRVEKHDGGTDVISG